MADYWNLRGFEDLYLEDSWVLEIRATAGLLIIQADLVLRESHPFYEAPKPGEQYCYRRGTIRFEGITDLTWTGQGAPPGVDASGEQDLGSFDQFSVAGSAYRIRGDFGRIEAIAQPPTVEFSAV